MNKKQKAFLISAILLIILAISIIAYTMSSPFQTSNDFSPFQVSNKLKVVTTFYPLTYLTQQIGDECIEIVQIVPDNTDIHSWEPSVSHIRTAEEANIIFYNGAGADQWMENNILPALTSNKNQLTVETTLDLPLITNNGYEHGHDDEDDEDGDDGHDHGMYDPHTWLSPYMAKKQAETIYNTLVSVDPEHEDYYTQRWNNLKQQLDELDIAYLTRLSDIHKDVIFVSHEAYGYLCDRYGFEQEGVIGLSADQQPSITTLNKLVNEMKEHQIYTLYFDPIYSDKYIQTLKTEVQSQTGQTVIVLKLYLLSGPMDGLDYLAQMQKNLDNLQIGLQTV